MTVGETRQRSTTRLFDTVEKAEHASLAAVRKFLDAVNDALPHLADERHRRAIVDSAFKMTEQLVATSTRLAQNIVEVTHKVRSESRRKPATPSKKAGPRTAKAAKKTVKKVAKKSTR